MNDDHLKTRMFWVWKAFWSFLCFKTSLSSFHLFQFHKFTFISIFNCISKWHKKWNKLIHWDHLNYSVFWTNKKFNSFWFERRVPNESKMLKFKKFLKKITKKLLQNFLSRERSSLLLSNCQSQPAQFYFRCNLQLDSFESINLCGRFDANWHWVIRTVIVAVKEREIWNPAG